MRIGKRLQVLLVVLFVLGGAAQVAGSIAARTNIDLLQDRVSSEAWRAGDDAYRPTRALLRQYEGREVRAFDEQHRNPHPPSLVLALTPITMMPRRVAHIVLALLEASALVAGMILLLRRFQLPLWLSVVPLVLPFVQLGLWNGAVSNMIFLGTVLSGLAFDRMEDKRGGVALGVVAALKLYPMLLLAPLLGARRWRACFWSAISFVGISTISALTIGPRPTWRWLTQAAPSDASQWATWPENISLGAPLYRRIGWEPVVGLLVLGICFLAATRTDFWRATPWVVLAPPIAWPHYGVMALPAIVGIARRWPIAAVAMLAALSAGVTGIAPLASTVALLILGSVLMGLKPKTVPTPDVGARQQFRA